MGKQYNKGQKSMRRKRYLQRQKEKARAAQQKRR